MPAQPVEWVLVVFYGQAAHQATYGRQVRGGGYTKDYIQLSRKGEFLERVASLFSVRPEGSIPLTFRWPGGSAKGAFVFKSADRPHLKWETSDGAPRPWKMAPSPNDRTVETIPGNPEHEEISDANSELKKVSARGAGQPYLMAIKLRGEPQTLHLRAYLGEPAAAYQWANLSLLPDPIQALARSTSQRKALAWSSFPSDGVVAAAPVQKALDEIGKSKDVAKAIGELDKTVGGALLEYLRKPGHGFFFDPAINHAAWQEAKPLPGKVSAELHSIIEQLSERFAEDLGDAAAEELAVDMREVDEFRGKIEERNFKVPDATATVKTRGSAQRAFADAVKSNYKNRCAVTGVSTRDFLVAAHIVPWSVDPDIRLDPSNGICLSLIVDRAFEKGYLQIDDDMTIRVDGDRLGSDDVLAEYLARFNGKKLVAPLSGRPRAEYLKRRRDLVAAADNASARCS